MLARENENFRTLGENRTCDPPNTIKIGRVASSILVWDMKISCVLFNSTWAGLFKAGLR